MSPVLSARRPCPDRPEPEEGSALLAVMGVVMVLSVVALVLTGTARTNIAAAHRATRAATVEALADAGAHAGAARLLEPTADAEPLVTELAFSLGKGVIAVRIVPEAGRIDLNKAPLSQIEELLRVLGVGDAMAARLAARLGDYRDPDDDRRTDGAELPEYRAAGLAHGPADGPLHDEAELSLVLGFPPELTARLRPFVTVFSGSEQIDPEAATPEVLSTLPGMTADRAQAMADRNDTPAPRQARGSAGRSGNAKVYRITATAALPDGTRFVREAVLKLGDEQRPWRFLSWREGA